MLLERKGHQRQHGKEPERQRTGAHASRGVERGDGEGEQLGAGGDAEQHRRVGQVAVARVV